jgi:hypothetical protein
MRELFHSAASIVFETTYLGVLLMRSVYGSPLRLGHAAANPSYVPRRSSSAFGREQLVVLERGDVVVPILQRPLLG